MCLSYGILIESALSYLGVGVQPPTPSWGTILNEGKEFLTLAPWVSLFPGAFIRPASPGPNSATPCFRKTSAYARDAGPPEICQTARFIS